MKILIISLAGIGDTLLATPLIRVLREQLPNAEIDLLVRWTGARDLVGGNPRVNRIHQKELVKAGAVGTLKFLRVLRRERYDVSINTHPQGKVQYRMIARLIGARLRLSHCYENYSPLDRLLVNRTIDQDYGIHCIENNFRLLPLMGLREPKELVDCELFFSAEEEQWAEEFIRSRKLSSSIRLGIHVGSGTTKNLMFKRWPVENYIALIKQVLAAYPNVAALLFGGPEEKQENQRILAAVNDARLLEVPSRTLKEAAALQQQQRDAVDQDGGA